jgi:hypothetical protein
MNVGSMSKLDYLKLSVKHRAKYLLGTAQPEPQAALAQLISDNPKFHFYQGELTSWSIQADTLKYLLSVLKPGMTTLETGCGQSTVVFAIAKTQHTCIMPNQDEARRVKQYCMHLGLKSNINFITKSSDIALPQRKRVPKVLDHVFIDGAHAFPAPIIDWHYTADKLKIGGILSLDDYKMPSVKILFDFMVDEEEWELLKIVQNTAFFKKIKPVKHIVDWSGQKINKDYPGY